MVAVGVVRSDDQVASDLSRPAQVPRWLLETSLTGSFESNRSRKVANLYYTCKKWTLALVLLIHGPQSDCLQAVKNGGANHPGSIYPIVRQYTPLPPPRTAQSAIRSTSRIGNHHTWPGEMDRVATDEPSLHFALIRRKRTHPMKTHPFRPINFKRSNQGAEFLN